jgi:4-aminobutyrate aminotransferase-like enzyme
MMLGFDLIDPGTGATAGPELCRRLFRSCLDAGILTVGDVPGVRLNPPLTLTLAEADQALEALSIGLGR